MLLIITTIFFTSTYLYFLIKHGKNPAKGGKLALCKKLWLFYTLYTWFIFLPIVLFEGYVSSLYFHSFLFLTVSMWLRAPVEIVMLYRTKNWTPPIGIAHNVLTFILFTFPLLKLNSPPLNFEFFFALSLGFSLIFETYYAYAFYKIVKEKTKGDDAIWFANKEDSQFKIILRVTTFFNIPAFLAVSYAFLKYLP